ncbi:hypothetical protein Tco_0039643 [Tanacetum coccineum]
MYRIATSTTQNREPQLPHASRNTNPHMSKSTGVNHTTSVSRPQLKCYQVKDKVVPNNSQVKFKKKEVEDHHRISSISKKTKSVTACNDSSNSRTSHVNAVCAECGKCVFNSNHDACVSRYLNDVNARTKKPKIDQSSSIRTSSLGNSNHLPVQNRRLLARSEMCMFALTEEGIDFKESFAPVARLEAEEVFYVALPEGSVDPDNPEKVTLLESFCVD